MSENTMIGVVTGFGAEWKDVDDFPPPQGKKIWLLTVWGVAVAGVYYPEGQFIAWSHMPKVPLDLKEKMRKKREAWVTG